MIMKAFSSQSEETATRPPMVGLIMAYYKGLKAMIRPLGEPERLYSVQRHQKMMGP